MKTKINSVVSLGIINEQKTKKLKPEDYDPEIWEDRYMTNRYLSGLTISDLENRHNEICTNLLVLHERLYPNLSANYSMSIWYWLSKEHETRFEAYLKGIEFYKPFFNPGIFSKHNIFLFHESKNTIFKYGTPEHIQAIIEKGEILFREASYYRDDNNQARRDDERRKKYYLNKEHVTITNIKTNKKIKPISNLIMTQKATFQNYIFCVSSYYDKQLFNKFDAEACVAITNREEFERRLSKKIPTNKNLFSSPVQYYDPWYLEEPNGIIPYISKDFRFALQGEYRFLIYDRISGKDTNNHGTITINLGSLKDITEFHTIQPK